ncbi:hypothetical protein HK405_010592 [Cladochytrium tenue]|nr:hypothetical protein HK405_010592 [Cladochytrium tenue]
MPRNLRLLASVAVLALAALAAATIATATAMPIPAADTPAAAPAAENSGGSSSGTGAQPPLELGPAGVMPFRHIRQPGGEDVRLRSAIAAIDDAARAADAAGASSAGSQPAAAGEAPAADSAGATPAVNQPLSKSLHDRLRWGHALRPHPDGDERL